MKGRQEYIVQWIYFWSIMYVEFVSGEHCTMALFQEYIVCRVSFRRTLFDGFVSRVYCIHVDFVSGVHSM